MKKINFSKHGCSETFILKESEIPKIIKKGQVLVRVFYSSLDEYDIKDRKGINRIYSRIFNPGFAPGIDLYGMIMRIAPDVREFYYGDMVMGYMNIREGGAFSQFVTINSENIIHCPEISDDASLGGLPYSGTTAWKTLVIQGNLQPNQSVLISNADGGIGHIAIQIAKACGANVNALCSSKNYRFCRAKGADMAFDITKF
ncbi:MAG: hypothetical protein JEZ03_16395, partial [Bacteroidales bacterium]|nr:hypothetical protein [Bacteroidales bacterium]